MSDPGSNYFQTAYNKLLVIYFGLLFGLLSFSCVLIFMLVEPGKVQHESNELFQMIVPIVVVSAVSFGIFMMGKTIGQAINEPSQKKKMDTFSSIQILQWGTLEGAMLFSNVVYLITTNPYFLYISIACLLYFLYLFPIKKRIFRQLKLDDPTGNY